MSRFGTKKISNNKTTNYAGGQSYKQSAELELASLLLTSFTKDKFYRTSEAEIKRLKELLQLVNPELACKAAVYTRQVAGMRSISHVLTAEIAPLIRGKEYARNFYNAVVRRPDDMLEILAYGKATNWAYKNKRMPMAMKRGFADALDKFDEYQLAKWRKQNNEISLLNVLHLVHAKPNDSLNSLYKNRLKMKNTRESVLSETGQIDGKENLTKVEIAAVKAENLEAGWRTLLSTKRIGYKALVGSLVKILNEAPEMVDIACEMIQDYNLIRKSLVMPSEIIVAYEQVGTSTTILSSKGRMLLLALENALNYSVQNAPKFKGETLVVLDESGSMTMRGGKPSRIGALFAAVLCKANNADLMTFANRARYRNYNPSDAVATIARGITFSAGGTNFHSIFQSANKRYDRVIILSDMQGWMGSGAPTLTFNTYCKKFNVDPYVYSWDLQGYGTSQFPSSKIFTLAGFNNNVFDIMKNLEESEQALIDKIKAVRFEDYTGNKKNRISKVDTKPKSMRYYF